MWFQRKYRVYFINSDGDCENSENNMNVVSWQFFCTPD